MQRRRGVEEKQKSSSNATGERKKEREDVVKQPCRNKNHSKAEGFESDSLGLKRKQLVLLEFPPHWTRTQFNMKVKASLGHIRTQRAETCT